MTNPFMSMWLSAINSAAGQARGFWTAEMHRQQTAMMNRRGRPRDRATYDLHGSLG